MNIMVSLSPIPMAHPPRSNPFLRSSSDAPPFPCITPSTESCVVVVNFMIAVPFCSGHPRGRPLTPTTNTSAPLRHRLPKFFRAFPGTPVVSHPTAQRFQTTAQLLAQAFDPGEDGATVNAGMPNSVDTKIGVQRCPETSQVVSLRRSMAVHQCVCRATGPYHPG